MEGTGRIFSKLKLRVGYVLALSMLLVASLASAPFARAQNTTATLSGTVLDADGAIIPKAKVVVQNKANKFVSTSTSNGSGVFNFSGLNSGDYAITITAQGFEKFLVTTVHLDPGDVRSVEGIKMKPGNVDVVVQIDATNQNDVQDTGERSSLITAKDLDKLSIEGRDVTELLKILPGSAIATGNNANGGATSNTTFDPGAVGFGGASGSYSVSGSPLNGVAIRSDGANLTDPTNGSTSLQTVNAESTAEVKIQTANFGADSANGPLVINAVGKSGGSDYHGSIYTYGRTSQLNSTDSVAKALGIEKAPDRYIYPGASIGGPIKIPGTNINKNKKLTFFANGEDYIQRNVYSYGDSVSASLTTALVPTGHMRLGDFSAAQVARYLPPPPLSQYSQIGNVAGPVGNNNIVCDPQSGIPCQPLANDSVSTSNPYPGEYQNFNNINLVPVSDSAGNPLNCDTGNCLQGKLDPGAVAQFSVFPLPNVGCNSPAPVYPSGSVTSVTATVSNPYGIGPSNAGQPFPGPSYPAGADIDCQTTGAGGSAYNYVRQNLVNQDIYQLHGRLDYAATDREKFFVSFTAENGKTTVPQGEGYFQSGSSGGLDTPGGTDRTNYTYTGSGNWNATFSPTLTNEFFASASYSDQIDAAGDGKLLFNTAIGYPYTGAYANGTKQFPNLSDYGYNGLPIVTAPDYSFGDLFNKAYVPGGGDNLTKQLGKHTVKVGLNVERPLINQTTQQNGSNPTNGTIANYYTGSLFSLPDPTDPTGEKSHTFYSTCYSPGNKYCSGINSNYLANYYEGLFSSYSQGNIDPILKLHAWTTSFYGTDDWKVTRKLSVTVGLRLEHIGRWTDEKGFGAAVFNPALYASDGFNLAGVSKYPLPGFRWHGIDSSTPISGFQTREFFYEPRVGFKYDVYGDGQTTLSGGWGQYRFRDGQADAINSALAPNGLRNASIGNPGTIQTDPYNSAPMTNPPPIPSPYASIGGVGLTAAYVQSLHLNPSPLSEAGAFTTTYQGGYPTSTQTFYGTDQNDDEAPLTTNYNLTVTQQLPKGLNLSIGYVGNNSNYLLDDNGNGPTLSNINALPVGALFAPDPTVGSTNYGLTFGAAQVGSVNTNDWRKYPHYGSIQVEEHKLTANYNAMQIVLNHLKGAVFFQFNYTYSKNMGIRGGYNNGNAGDSFNYRNDYGPLGYDRTHIANATYNFDFGSKYHGYRLLKPVVNGWQVSGITTIQSGPNLQATNYSTNFSLGGYIPATPGQSTYPVNNTSYLGTTDVSLQPKVTCDPAANLRSRQYINGNCFALPAFGGDNGPIILPYLHGPAYFQSDLTLVKDFKVREKQTLEFRAAAFNFINYRLPTFSGRAAPGELTLTYPLISDPYFGATTVTSGRRVLELSLKFSY